MGINDVTTWAKKRLAEGAGLSAPTVSGQHGAGTAPAPAQPSIEAAPAPQKAVSHWCDVDQPLHASEVTDQVPPTPKKPLALDPGERALLALAMAFCARTGAGDKARQDWQRDVADTPPELRGDLYQHLREQCTLAPPAPPTAASTRPPAPAKPMGRWHMNQPWRGAGQLYERHHWQCPECMAAARAAPGVMARCAAGERLHSDYTAQAATA